MFIPVFPGMCAGVLFVRVVERIAGQRGEEVARGAGRVEQEVLGANRVEYARAGPALVEYAAGGVQRIIDRTL